MRYITGAAMFRKKKRAFRVFVSQNGCGVAFTCFKYTSRYTVADSENALYEDAPDINKRASLFSLAVVYDLKHMLRRYNATVVFKLNYGPFRRGPAFCDYANWVFIRKTHKSYFSVSGCRAAGFQLA